MGGCVSVPSDDHPPTGAAARCPAESCRPCAAYMERAGACPRRPGVGFEAGQRHHFPNAWVEKLALEPDRSHQTRWEAPGSPRRRRAQRRKRNRRRGAVYPSACRCCFRRSRKAATTVLWPSCEHALIDTLETGTMDMGKPPCTRRPSPGGGTVATHRPTAPARGAGEHERHDESGGIAGKGPVHRFRRDQRIIGRATWGSRPLRTWRGEPNAAAPGADGS